MPESGTAVTEMLLAIGALGFVIATVITSLVVRAARQTRRNEDDSRRAAEESRLAAEAHRRSEQVACLEAQRQHWVEEEARVATDQEAQRRAEADACHEAEEARVAADAETRHRAEEELRNETGAEAVRRAEEQARVVAEAEALGNAEVQTRVQAENARLKADEDARVAADSENMHRGEEESRRETEAEAARRAAEQVGVVTDAKAQCEVEVQARVEEKTSRRKAEAEACRKSEEARVAAEEEAQHRTEVGLVTLAIPNLPVVPIRDPRQYRAVPRVPTAPAAPRSRVPASVEQEPRDRALPIEVRLVFEKAGFCRVSLLPRRAVGMPIEMAVTGSGNPPELLALQDEWYQDVVLPDLARLLREGIEWAGALTEGRRARFSLSGRELYVLARHSQISSFVSAPRLMLDGDNEQVVLCLVERLNEVRAAIALTGSPEPTLLNSASGIPSGWAGLRGVIPRTPIAPSPAGDILDALRPLAEVKIALEGGIRIDRQTWLSGFPPSVRLRGDTSTIGAVTIDGQDAALSAGGGYAVPGWDSPGEHSVWCTSGSRTYEIRGGAEDWESWDAYAWSLGESGADGTQSRPAICGVLVRPPRVGRSDGRAVLVPASNPILIGASPGELEICKPRNDVRTELCVGFPWFKPVWAIPANAFRCDKRTGRVLLMGPPLPVAEGEQQPNWRPDGRRARLHHSRIEGAIGWCEAILTAGRKGLQTEPSQTEIANLWTTYKRAAKAIRRSWR